MMMLNFMEVINVRSVVIMPNKFLLPFAGDDDQISNYHLYEAMQQAQEFIHQQNRLGNVNRKTMKALLYLEKAMKDEEWVVYYP